MILVLALVLAFSVNCFAGIAPESPTNTSIINLTWTAVGDNGNEGTASYYDLRYSEKLITDSTWETDSPVVGEPQPSVAGSAESFQVQGLEDNKTYYFVIRVYDWAGNWSVSNVARVKTRDTMPPGLILKLERGN